MSGLSPAALQSAYEALARAIDRAVPEQEALFLARLALLLAEPIGDAAAMEREIEAALAELPAPVPTAPLS